MAKSKELLVHEDTMKQMIEDLTGVKSNIKHILYNSHGGTWEIHYHKGEMNEFESFQEVYEFITTESAGF